MALWKLEEARLVQERSNVSVADALFLAVGYPGVPPGKCWVIIGASAMPSVAETQYVCWEKYNTYTGFTCPLINSIQVPLNPARFTYLEQGMEHLLLPGEYLIFRRAAATAGSTLENKIQFIEIDLPLYTYDEPQIVKRQVRGISSLRQRLGGSPGSRGSGGPGAGPGTIPHGGGGGGALPV